MCLIKKLSDLINSSKIVVIIEKILHLNIVYLLLGSNLGHRYKNLLLAKYFIAKNVGKIDAQSQIYETSPWGVKHKTNYLNQALKVKTSLSPFQLLKKLHAIEKTLGRKNKKLNAPRTIDIDILFYNQVIFKTKQLEIPHPRLHLRRFTLLPLVEIGKSYTHPILQTSIEDLSISCKDDSKVSIFKPE